MSLPRNFGRALRRRDLPVEPNDSGEKKPLDNRPSVTDFFLGLAAGVSGIYLGFYFLTQEPLGILVFPGLLALVSAIYLILNSLTIMSFWNRKVITIASLGMVVLAFVIGAWQVSAASDALRDDNIWVGSTNDQALPTPLINCTDTSLQAEGYDISTNLLLCNDLTDNNPVITGFFYYV